MLATIINSTSLPVKGRRRGIGGISNWTELPWAFRAVTVLGKKTDSVYKWNPATKTLSLKLTILLWQGKLALSVWNDQQLCCTATPLENQDNASGKDTNSSLWVVHPYHPGTLQCEAEKDGQQLGSHHFLPNFQPHLLLHKEKKTYFVGKLSCLSPQTQVQAMQTCKSNLWLGSIP